MTKNQEIIESILSDLKRKVPFLSFTEKKENSSTVWTFDSFSGADYYFHIWAHNEGDFQIGASLKNGQSNNDLSFWYYPFEINVGIPENKIFSNFSDCLNKLIYYPSRIIQKRGLLFWSFQMQVLINDKWEDLYGMSCTRLFFKAPPMKGSQAIYHSPALVS
jgi:hypothetical protein